MIFVSMAKLDEWLVGVVAAAIATVAGGVVRAKKFASFYPHMKSMVLVLWEPWYALKGTVVVFAALGRRILGRKSKSKLRAIPFQAGSEDPESAARRALAIIFSTISPDTVVIGIDQKNRLMLIHEIAPAGTPLIAQRLGARE